MSKSQDTLQESMIRQLAQILSETGLSEIEYEVEGCRLRVARTLAPTHAVVTPAPTVAPSQGEVKPAEETTVTNWATHPGAVKSPMVGTAYLAPQPEAPAFVNEGDKVTKGQTLLIIEAMKVMNQINAPCDGVVKKVLVHAGDPVEYDSVLMVIEAR